MKVEEAIRLVEIAFGYSSAIHDCWKEDYEAEEIGAMNPDDEAEKIAIEAMKKQVAMKPDRLCGFSCRNCSGRLARQTDLVRQKYCHHCGQKIEWEE